MEFYTVFMICYQTGFWEKIIRIWAYLLTLFFFIFQYLGLVPIFLRANVTGNITVTLTLACHLSL